jgi:MarR family multiple antibiotic resistance transcriptional regulator
VINLLAWATTLTDTNDLFNQIIPLGRLIHLVNQHKDRLLSEHISPLEVTPRQFKVLCAIHYAECVTPVELRKLLSVDSGALTRMLDRLIDRGWVARQPNPKDKRGVLIRLTAEGVDLCERCRCLLGQSLHQELTKNLTTEEIILLEDLLRKVLP